MFQWIGGNKKENMVFQCFMCFLRIFVKKIALTIFDDILFEQSAANLRDATVAQCDVMSARLDIC